MQFALAHITNILTTHRLRYDYSIKQAAASYHPSEEKTAYGGDRPVMASPLVSSVRLQSGYVVECDHMEGIWVISDYELLDGEPFLRLNPHNSGLSRVITSASRGVRGLKSPWFAEARHMRNEGRVKRVLHGAAAPLFAAASSKAKKQRERKQAQDLDDPAVSYPLVRPRVQYNDMVAGPLTLQVKNTSNFKEHVTIELKAENLEYIRLAVLKRGEENEAEMQRKRAEALQAPQGVKRSVFERDDRQAYIAKRLKPDGSAQYKTVRPATKDLSGMYDARCLASRWADGASSASSDSEVEDEQGGEGHRAAAAVLAIVAAPAGA